MDGDLKRRIWEQIDRNESRVRNIGKLGEHEQDIEVLRSLSKILEALAGDRPPAAPQRHQ
jgi:hypothetical protein